MAAAAKGARAAAAAEAALRMAAGLDIGRSGAVAHRSGMQCVHDVIDINSVVDGGLYALALRGQQRNVT